MSFHNSLQTSLFTFTKQNIVLIVYFFTDVWQKIFIVVCIFGSQFQSFFTIHCKFSQYIIFWRKSFEKKLQELSVKLESRFVRKAGKVIGGKQVHWQSWTTWTKVNLRWISERGREPEAGLVRTKGEMKEKKRCAPRRPQTQSQTAPGPSEQLSERKS